MRKRGITDFDKVQTDGWAVGQVQATHQGSRLLRALSYFKGDSINFYGRPIEGVVALVNLNTEKVIEVVDTGVVPLARATQELDEKSTGRREAPKRSRSLSRTAPAFRFRPGDSLAENGAFATRCTRAKAWSCTLSAMKMKDACAQYSIARRFQKWLCLTATRMKTGAGAVP